MSTPAETITIAYISPAGVTTDITRNVLFSDAYFEAQAAAVPGSFHLTVKDPNQSMSFVSGGRIELTLGTQKVFGGFITVPTRDFFFAALDTSEPVTGRRWSLDGVDYNHLLDKRILRNTANYTHSIPDVLSSSGNNTDAGLIGLFATYFDLDFAGGGTIGVTVDRVNNFSYQPLTGRITKTSGDLDLTGSGTKFLDELGYGDRISVPGGGGTDTLRVTTIYTDTHCKVKVAPTHSGSTSSARRLNTQFTWPTQGSTMRQTLDAIVIETTIHGALACIYWLDAYADIQWLAIPRPEDESPWGFSDVPSGPAYNADGDEISIPFIGWRDGTASEDGSSVINEVFVWGGSALGTSGDVVIAHKSNSASITAHGRWQMAENHPGEDLYKSKAQVNARANALISGSTSGTSPVTGAQGLVNPDRQYNLTWFAHDVPVTGAQGHFTLCAIITDGVEELPDDTSPRSWTTPARQHLVPGKTTTLNLWSFGTGGKPFALVLPLRQVRITFPTLPSERDPGDPPQTYVQFQGAFSLSMSDPVWWWQYLRTRRPAPQPQPVITTDNSSSSYPYNSYFQGAPKETPDGSRKLFSIIPTYQPGTLEVYLNGALLLAGSGYAETTPNDLDGGTFTFATAPAVGAEIICKCRTG